MILNKIYALMKNSLRIGMSASNDNIIKVNFRFHSRFIQSHTRWLFMPGDFEFGRRKPTHKSSLLAGLPQQLSHRALKKIYAMNLLH